MSEWTGEQARNKYAEVAGNYPDSLGDLRAGRALLTLEAERDEALSKVTLLETAAEHAANRIEALHNEVARMRPVVEAAEKCRNADLDLSGKTRIPLDLLIDAVDRYRASAQGGAE